MADRVSRRALIASAGLGAGGVALALALGSRERPQARLASRIEARRRDGALPLDDPGSDEWLAADPVLVPLLAQRIAQPFLAEVAVETVEIEALHNGEEIGFRVSWDDPEADEVDGLAQFRDALAVQLPAAAGEAPPPIMMGGPGLPVHILQWRATWERDVGDRVEVEDVYPDAVHDVVPDDILPPEVARLYYPGREVGNPLSERTRTTTVEEIVAEGFGSVTALTEQRARGRGVHADGRWRVVLGFPMTRGSAGEPLEPGSVWPVSFAVWRGDAGNRGGRKQYADWIELEVTA